MKICPICGSRFEGRGRASTCSLACAKKAYEDPSNYLTMDGETHHVAVWAEFFGTSSDAIRKRMEDGLTLWEALTSQKPRDKVRLFTIFGEHLTIDEICEKYGVKRNTFTGRLSRGDSPEQAVRPAKNNTAIEVDGEVHTIAEWSRISGISYQTICGRLNRGAPPKIAVFEKNAHRVKGGGDSKHGSMYTFNGKTQSISEWAKETGIPFHTLLWRIDHWNDFDRAIQTPVRQRKWPPEE